MATPSQLRNNRKRRWRQARQQGEKTATYRNSQSRGVIAAAFFVLACVFLLVSGCGSRPQVFKWSGETMGTYYRVTLVSDSELHEPQQLSLREETAAELVRLNQVFSTYSESSEISRWNQLPAGACLRLSPSMFDVVKIALDTAGMSQGYFNPFVGSLVEAWGFGAANGTGIVSPNEVEALLASTRLSAVLFDETARTLCKSNEANNVRMDLSAVAKGYAADQLAAMLMAHGFTNLLIDIGGELYAHGLNPRGDAWRLAIEKPVQALQQVQQLIAVSDRGVATSGDYRNFYVDDGRRYSHTIDPRTGYPVIHDLASVTAVASSAALADAWATAILAAGLERSETWIERHNLAIFAIRRDNDSEGEHRVWYSDAFLPYVLNED